MIANVKWAVLLMVAVVFGGCSDSASTGIPYAAEDLTIDTQLDMTAVKVGGTATATCTVTHKTSGVVSVATSLATNPQLGIRVAGKSVTPDVAGLFNIGCIVTELPTVVDTTPVTLVASTSGAAMIDTFITPETTVPGEATTVDCRATDWAGNPVEAETTFTVVPPEKVTVEGNTITTLTEGKYEVICSLVELPSLMDGKPAVWTVDSGEPAKVVATLSGNEIASGDKTTVTCRAEDNAGNPVSGVEYSVSSDPAEGLLITGTEIAGAKAGQYDIHCAVVGNENLPSTPDVLTVTAGTPVGIELFVDPDQDGYAPGAEVEFSWNVLDSQENVVQNAEVTLTAPANGVSLVSGTTYKLAEEGAHSFTAAVANNQSLKATRVLYVDADAPELVISYPTRGLTLTQTEDGDEFVQVAGTILDPVSGVATLTINGNKVSIADDGSFSFSIQSEHGLNVVDVEGIDAAGNVASQAIGYYYSTVYQNYEETTLEDVKLNNAMKVFLGKDVIDDGDHDKENIDDLATLIEVVLTEADLNVLLGETLAPIVFPDVLDLEYPEGWNCQDSIVITPTFSQADISPNMFVNLTPIEGGITAEGAISKTDDGSDGLVLQLTVEVALQFTCEGAIETGLFPITLKATASQPVSTQTYATVEELTFSSTYLINKDADGPLNVDGKNFNIQLGDIAIEPLQDTKFEFLNIEYEVLSGIIMGDLPIDLFPGDFFLTEVVDDFGELMGDLITPLSNFLSTELDFVFKPILEDVAAETLKAALLSLELETSMEVETLDPNKPGMIDLIGELYTVTFTPDGGTVGIKAGAWAEKNVEYNPLGSIIRDSCAGKDLGAFKFSEEAPMAIALNMDFVNEFLFSGWWSGALNMNIDNSDLNDEDGDLKNYGIKAIRLNPLLPPILSDCNDKGLLRIQLGDAELEVDFDGGLVTEPTTMKMFTSLDAGIYVETYADSLGIIVTGFDKFHIDLVDAGPEWESLEAELEVALESEMKTQIENLLIEALGNFPVPAIDLTGVLPGVPNGTALQVGTTETALSNGFLLVEGDLE